MADNSAGGERGIGDAVERSLEQVRETAKWLIASFAAVGGALIAGSQLSSIGTLEVCSPSSLDCARLPIALIGAIVGLTAVICAIVAAVRALLPKGWTLAELVAEEQENPGGRLITFFHGNPEYMQGFRRLADLKQEREDAVNTRREAVSGWKDASEADKPRFKIDAEDALAREHDLNVRARIVGSIALYRSATEEFRRCTLPALLAAGVFAAVGIIAFAWAANPPQDPTPSLRHAKLVEADLGGVNLTGVDLTGADLTGANLRGANLRGATLNDVTWANTTCPDGTNSDQANGSCLGHLLQDGRAEES